MKKPTLLREDARRVIADEFAKWTEAQELARSQPMQALGKIEDSDHNEKVGKPRKRKKEG